MDVALRRKAMYAEDDNLIYLARNLVCTGSNFFDTGFAAFSSANINTNFKITIRLSSFTPDPNVTQAVILGCKYEGTKDGLQWPGIYIRRNGTKFDIGGYNYYQPVIANTLNNNIQIWRKNGSFKCLIDGMEQKNLSVRSTTFDQNIVLGAGVQTDGTKFRYSKCTIDYIRIEYI